MRSGDTKMCVYEFVLDEKENEITQILPYLCYALTFIIHQI